MTLLSQNQAGRAGDSCLPRHVAVIMDGNGRWAQRRGLPRTAGHRAGAENFRAVATACKELGIEHLTVYAFSTENWKRPKAEVDAILALLEQYLRESVETMARDRIRLCFLGDTAVLPPRLRALIAETDGLTRRIEGFQANVCLNYGGRAELLHAAQAFTRDCMEGKASPDNLTEAAFSGYLWSAGLPDPELLIRTGGELRLSNFLLWQCAYSEFYVTDTLWPDFGRDELDRALDWYRTRDRRFGGLSTKK